jgi:hypothetical protein
VDQIVQMLEHHGCEEKLTKKTTSVPYVSGISRRSYVRSVNLSLWKETQNEDSTQSNLFLAARRFRSANIPVIDELNTTHNIIRAQLAEILRNMKHERAIIE